MEQVLKDSEKIVSTLGGLLKESSANQAYRVLSEGTCAFEVTGFDNWDGGTDIFSLYCVVPIGLFTELEPYLESIETEIRQKAELIFRSYSRTWLGEVIISPVIDNTDSSPGYKNSWDDLFSLVQSQKELMVSVATGCDRIQEVNSKYLEMQAKIEEGLSERGIANPNPYNDLWEWYDKWSDGSLATYKSRRTYLKTIFGPLMDNLKEGKNGTTSTLIIEPTGWTRVDRNLKEIGLQLRRAKAEEQFQAIGLLCRETLISLSQVVYRRGTHKSIDGVEPSKTDAKRMLEAYIGSELIGRTNETIRKYARASLSLANDLTHKRTADFRLAALCAEATYSVVKLIAIISGRRNSDE